MQVEAKPAAERQGWNWGALAALDGVSIRSFPAPTTSEIEPVMRSNALNAAPSNARYSATLTPCQHRISAHEWAEASLNGTPLEIYCFKRRVCGVLAFAGGSTDQPEHLW